VSFKIPSFLSTKFSKATSKEDKDKLVQIYKNWYANEITQEFIKSLEDQLNTIQEEEDSKIDFVSLFQSKYIGANYKGQKKILRKLQKQLNHEL